MKVRLVPSAALALLMAFFLFSPNAASANEPLRLVCVVPLDTPTRIASGSPACSSPAAGSSVSVFVDLKSNELSIKWNADDHLVPLRFGIEIPRSDEPIGDVTLEIARSHGGGGAETVVMLLRADDLREIKAIRLPAASYRISSAAVGFRPVLAEASLTGTANVPPVNLRLQRSPRVRGIVRDAATLKAVSNVQVSAKTGERAAGADGRFTLVVGKLWPSVLLVTAPGYPDTVVRVPPSTGDVNLGDLAIGHGGQLALDIVHDEELQLRVVPKSDREGVLRPITRSIAKDVDHIEIPHLAPGIYVAHIEGPEPLEKFSADIGVTEAQTTYRTIMLTPRFLHITTRVGDKAVEVPRLDLTNNDAGWSASVATNTTGVLDARYWQSGRFRATVHMSDGGAYVDTATIENDAESWNIEIPERRLEITLVDAETGANIADGGAIAEYVGTASSLKIARNSDPDGRITFRALPVGRTNISVMSRGYAEANSTVDFSESDSLKQVSIPLQKAPRVQLHVVDSSGFPVSRADALAWDGGSHTVTDESGNCAVQMTNYGRSRVFVIPREGSFAFADVDTERDKEPLPVLVNVPSGDSRLVIHVRSSDGSGAVGVRFLFTYNGQTIPAGVLQLIEREQMARDMTDGTGTFVLNRMPVGTYQVSVQGSEALATRPKIVTIAAQPSVNLAVIDLPEGRPAH